MIKTIMKSFLILFFLLGSNVGCSSDRDDTAKNSAVAGSGMKCGAGKCGANMFDGSAALVKKKANITKQMREDDPRRECVADAKTTKAVYDCVRDPESGKLSKKCGNDTNSDNRSMKCGAGKCDSM